MAMRFHKVTSFADEQIDTLLRDKVLYLVGEADPFAVMGGKAAGEINMKAVFR